MSLTTVGHWKYKIEIFLTDWLDLGRAEKMLPHRRACLLAAAVSRQLKCVFFPTEGGLRPVTWCRPAPNWLRAVIVWRWGEPCSTAGVPDMTQMSGMIHTEGGERLSGRRENCAPQPVILVHSGARLWQVRPLSSSPGTQCLRPSRLLCLAAGCQNQVRRLGECGGVVEPLNLSWSPWPSHPASNNFQTLN